MLSETFKWLVQLVLVDACFAQAELISLSELTNLRLLTVSRCPETLPNPKYSVDDTVFKAWSMRAKDAGRFPTLGTLALRGQMVSERVFDYLENFSRLQHFAVADEWWPRHSNWHHRSGWRLETDSPNERGRSFETPQMNPMTCWYGTACDGEPETEEARAQHAADKRTSPHISLVVSDIPFSSINSMQAWFYYKRTLQTDSNKKRQERTTPLDQSPDEHQGNKRVRLRASKTQQLETVLGAYQDPL